MQKEIVYTNFYWKVAKIQIGNNRKSELQLQIESVKKKINRSKWLETIDDVFRIYI